MRETATLQITLLGTGSSGGVPRVTNDWGACDATEPRNRRRRCSALIEQISNNNEKTSVLIDTGPDCREQLLSANVQSLEGVVITHPHADHIVGIDDLRQLAITLARPIDVYMDENTAKSVKAGFGYCFSQAPGTSYPLFCSENRIDVEESIRIDGPGGEVVLHPFEVEHGDIHALGFRIGDMAYVPDMKRLSNERSAETLSGVRVLIVDALREKLHPSHMGVDECLAFIKQISPKRAVLTNMASELDYRTLCDKLPPGIEPGYDGMCLS